MKKLEVNLLWSMLLLFSVVFSHRNLNAQIEVSFTTEINTSCSGSECDYEGPGILINEIMLAPSVGDGSLWGGTFSNGGEWIELYNPDICEPVDVSCYYLGNNANDGGNYPGGYVIPPGTVVPPAGFVLIRGINASPVPAELLVENGGNTIELVVTGSGVCVGGGTRLWFPNAGGWFAFYNSEGEPQDAVSWTSANNTSFLPCVPPLDGCGFSGNLVNYVDIPDDRKNYILSGNPQLSIGQSIRRIPDGGAWSGLAQPTYAYCNGDCIDPGESTCNGSATVIASGAGDEFFYQWNDAQLQTTATAVGLCAQEYCVLVTNNLGDSTEVCVTIEELSYETDAAGTFCEGNSFQLPDGTTVSQNGIYEVMLQTDGGCDSLVTIELEMFPSYHFELEAEICEDQTYTLPGGDEVNQQGVYVREFSTQSGCDSIYTVALNVEPVINVPQEFTLCQGETHILPDGTEVGTEGMYEVLMPGADCDSLFAVAVNVNPTYHLQLDAEICIGESYVLPDGTNVEDAGLYEVQLTTAEGCDSIIETLVMVHELPEVEISMDEVFCFQPGTVSVNTSPEGGILTFNNSVIEDNSLNMNSFPPGEYSVQYSFDDQNGCSNNRSHTFQVLSPLTPDFIFDANCFKEVRFTNLTADEDSSYHYIWTINDTVFSETFSPTYLYEEAGEYDVTLTAVNAANCVYSSVQTIELEEGMELAEYWLPNVITPNGDDANQHLLLMPNGDECLEYRLTIFNRWGKKVYETTPVGAPFAGVSDSGVALENGVYYYLLESNQIDCNNAAYEGLCKGSVHVFR